MKYLVVSVLFPVFLFSGCGRISESPVVEVDPSPVVPEFKFDEAALTQIRALGPGSSKQELIGALGEPDGQMNLGDAEILYYHGVEVKIERNQVVSIPDNFVEELQAGIAKTQEQTKAEAAKKSVQENQNLRQGGKQIDIHAMVGKGAVTIVDFYADWCGPCRQAEPHLKKLAEDPKVNLIQIDIVNWSTPVVAQYGLNSIPNMRVFDAEGNQVGSETHSVSKIQSYVKKAKR